MTIRHTGTTIEEAKIGSSDYCLVFFPSAKTYRLLYQPTTAAHAVEIKRFRQETKGRAFLADLVASYCPTASS